MDEWKISVTPEYRSWLDSLDEKEQDSLAESTRMLRQHGPQLSRPHADTLWGSRHGNPKEPRTQHAGRPCRSLFIFDPHRTAILLIGGDKTGDDRFYQRMIPLADRLYDRHLAILREEQDP